MSLINHIQMHMKELIINKDYEGIRKTLENNPSLANEGMPYDDQNTTKAHPLHRICDAVFSQIITDDEAVKIARLFLEHSANVNGEPYSGHAKDSPLTGAASLHADKVAMLYMEKGADIHHAGCHGGTALHWAAWCGRPNLVKALTDAGSGINRLCIDYKSTPLFWAVHGLKNGGYTEISDCIESVKTLLAAGADKEIPNGQGEKVFNLLDERDEELKEIFLKASK